MLAERWKLPVRLSEAIGCHHRPDVAQFAKREAATVHIADALARALALGGDGDDAVPPVSSAAWERLELAPAVLDSLLRELESRGLVRGYWEHPEKRSRRLYSVTTDGEAEYERLMHAMEPFLDSIVESITLIKREVYGNGAVQRKKSPAARRR